MIRYNIKGSPLPNLKNQPHSLNIDAIQLKFSLHIFRTLTKKIMKDIHKKVLPVNSVKLCLKTIRGLFRVKF